MPRERAARRRSAAGLAAAVALPGLLVSCAEGTPEAASSALRLELVDSIGVAGLPGEPEDLIFGRLTSVAITEDGVMYALDAGADRVAVIRDGEVVRFIGGSGEGPGEFGAPSDVAVADDGRLSVLDRDRAKVTRFDRSSGELIDERSGLWSRNLVAHRFRGDTIWLATSFVRSDTLPVLRGATMGGREVAGPPHPDPDRDFTGVTSLDAVSGRLVASTPRPGVWWELAGGEWTRVGSPMFPDEPPEIDTRVRPGLIEVTPSPVGVGEIAIAGDSLVIQLARHWPGITPESGLEGIDRQYFLAIFDVGGDFVGRIDVPDAVWNGCLEAGGDGLVVLCARDPYPRLLVYRLVPE